jgi:subtilisin-like proprotein convertase family protein
MGAPMRKSDAKLILVLPIALMVILTGDDDLAAQGVRGFGVSPGKLQIRAFGNPRGEDALRQQFPEAAAAIVGDDRSLARSQIARVDANGDGMATEQEWVDSGHQTLGHFRSYDLNGDRVLTLYEHCIGIARWRRRNERRADQQTSAERVAARGREQPTGPPAILAEAPATDPQVAARREQVQRLADHVIRVYDVNESRILERDEFDHSSAQFGNVAGADRDRNGEIERDEVAVWLQSRLPPLSRLTMELQSRDLDQDDQITISEFAEVVDAGSVDEFARWDRNGDGLITPRESLAPPPALSKHENRDSLVIKPSASIVSDIWIEEELQIDRLQVHVTITKENDNFAALFLVGPRGRRVTLYAGDGWVPWRGAQILRGVTFDDDAPLIKTTLKQPPYRRQLRPPGQGRKEDPTLKLFSGESARGTWRLIVRNQDDRVGLLLDWSLVITPRGASG